MNKKYHQCNGRYWYTAINGWGNEYIIHVTKEEWEAHGLNDVRYDEQWLEQQDVDDTVTAFRMGAGAGL